MVAQSGNSPAAQPPLLDRLERWLATAALPPDGRLPPERTLAQTFAVSRTELRKALALLQAEGRLQRSVGRGTFLKPVPSAPPIVEMVAGRTSPPEAVQARLLIEPELAGLAALAADAAQIAEMRRLLGAMRAADTWSAYGALDARFHALIAEASGNRVLAAAYRVINGVRRSLIVQRIQHQTIKPPDDHHSFGEHERIVEAIERRDRATAAEAMRAHIEKSVAAFLT